MSVTTLTTIANDCFQIHGETGQALKADHFGQDVHNQLDQTMENNAPEIAAKSIVDFNPN